MREDGPIMVYAVVNSGDTEDLLSGKDAGDVMLTINPQEARAFAKSMAQDGMEPEIITLEFKGATALLLSLQLEYLKIPGVKRVTL